MKRKRKETAGNDPGKAGMAGIAGQVQEKGAMGESLPRSETAGTGPDGARSDGTGPDSGGNPLSDEKISKLLRQFAVPSIIAMLVSAIYNIVDQFFIGQSVGPLGNAATNIAFPLSMMCTALALLFGVGGSFLL